MIHQNIREEIKKAMLEKDSLRLSVLRGLLSAFTNELVSKKRKPSEELSDEEAIQVIQRSAKQRKESIEQFRKGNREELAKKEEEELKILKEYMPEMMDKEKIREIILKKKEELGIEDKSKMGILMGAVMKELKGKAEGGDVKEIIEEIF